MKFEDIELIAFGNSGISDKESTEDKLAYYMLRNLYNEFEKGNINREYASKKKVEIKSEILNKKKSNEFLKGVYEQSVKLMNEISEKTMQITKKISQGSPILEVSEDMLQALIKVGKLDESVLQKFIETYKK